MSGVLACLDGYMNIALEQTEEYVNGQLKNKYGDAFIRGNNGIFRFVFNYLKFYSNLIYSFVYQYSKEKSLDMMSTIGSDSSDFTQN